MKSKFLVAILIFTVLSFQKPPIVVHSQGAGEPICGYVFLLDAGTRRFPAFMPYGSETPMIFDNIYGVQVTSTGETFNPEYDRYVKLWNPRNDIGDPQYISYIDAYQYVGTCAPQIVPTNTAIPPTNTPVPPTFTPIPTWTPIPPTSTRLPTKTPIPPTSTPLPTSTSIPPTLVPTATPYDGPLPNDGYEPSPSWLDKISQFFAPPVEASYSPADCQQRFYEGQCTWFVAGKRPDACQWIASGMGNAYQWASQAEQKNASELGISVSNVPHEGDIVVWSASCGGTSPIPKSGEPCTKGESGNYEGCGHVAYVTWASSDGKTIKIEEMNWSIDRSKEPLEVLKCMSFISSPSEKNATNSTPAPISIATPNPVIVPTPSGEPSTFNPFQWIIDLFKR